MELAPERPCDTLLYPLGVSGHRRVNEQEHILTNILVARGSRGTPDGSDASRTFDRETAAETVNLDGSVNPKLLFQSSNPTRTLRIPVEE
jgi:hypothetical protein